MSGPKTNLQAVMAQLNSSGQASGSSSLSPEKVIAAPKFKLPRSSTSARTPMSVASSSRTLVDRPVNSARPMTSIMSFSAKAMQTPEPVLHGRINTPQSQTSEARRKRALAISQSAEAGPSRLSPAPPPASATTGGVHREYPAELDALPMETLFDRLYKNMEKKTKFIQQKAAMDRGEPIDDDPDTIAGMLEVLEKSIRNLKAARVARGTGTPRRDDVSSVHSSAPTLPDPAPLTTAYPTPTTGGAKMLKPNSFTALEWQGQRPKGLSSEDSPRLVLGEINVVSDDEVPPPPSRPSTIKKRRMIPSSPPHNHDLDLADAEMDDMPDELIPPSSPADHPPATPSKSTRRRPPVLTSAEAAVAEMADIPPDAFQFSPPPSPRPPLPRAEASTFVPIQPSQVGQVPRPVKLAVKYPWDKEVADKLRQYFKIPAFRHHQKEAIDATMSGKDVFVLMPTGGGKSLTYQLPAICQGGKTRGITFVVSPLISLINDQTRHLSRLGIPAIAYTGEMSAGDKAAAHEQMRAPEPWTKVVYVTPEMMILGGVIKGILRDLLRRQRLARFVIDEAHCVSQWGHDFREDYQKLGSLRSDYPGVPIMALTATAQNKVQEDIIRSLKIDRCEKLKQSFNRPNLHYEVRPKSGSVINDMVAFISTKGKGASGIIYCSSRNKCEDIAKVLKEKHGLRARHYHAGMSKGDRRKSQEDWQEHEFEIIVATVAFGMGIDKPDVRYVIHHSLPRSLEGYYQETGRAGRDGNQSACVLYYTFGDYQSVVNMINRDSALDGKIEQKQRQKDSMAEVLAFCTNKTDCRRAQVLRYFNEVFEVEKCARGCDICLTKEQNVYNDEDVTEDAITVLKMLQAFDRSERLTIKNLADCYRGYGGNSAKGLGANTYFGAGKHWNQAEGQRLMETMLMKNMLEEYSVANAMGWSNSYIKLGRDARQLLNRNIGLTMQFRQASPRKPSAKKTKRQAGQAQIDSFARPVSNPVSRKRSQQQIDAEMREFDNSGWGDTDDGEYIASDNGGSSGPELANDPIELSDDDATEIDEPLATKRRKTAVASRNAKAGPSKLAARAKPAKAAARKLMQTIEDVDEVMEIDGDRQESTKSPCERCLAQLKVMHSNVLAKNRTAPKLTEQTLQMIAVIMPQNVTALTEMEGITSAHVKAYGTRILAITVKFKPFMEHAEPLRTSAASAGPKQTIRNIQSYAYDAGSRAGPSTTTTTTTTTRKELSVTKSGFLAKGASSRPRF